MRCASVSTLIRSFVDLIRSPRFLTFHPPKTPFPPRLQTTTPPQISQSPIINKLTVHQTKPLKKPRHPITMRLSTLLTATATISTANAGPLGYGICQAGCSAVVMACYSAAGAVWGATAGIGAAPAVLACNAGYGTCQAACAVVALTPTP